MRNEAQESGVIKPAPQDTEHNIHSALKELGIIHVNNEQEIHDETQSAVEGTGASFYSPDASQAIVSGDLSHEQFEEPRKFPVNDTRRWFGFFNKLRIERRNKNAA